MRSATLLASLLLLASSAPAEDPAPPKPAPPEPKTETLHGLPVEIVIPREKPADGRSLLIYFPRKSEKARDAAGKLAAFSERGFVVAVPSAKQGEWAVPEIQAAKAVAKDLADRFEVPPGRCHVAGLWTGAECVQVLAFDEAAGFRTATWIDSGWSGGTVQKKVKEELRGLFLWGAKEGPSRVDRYRKGAALLSERLHLAVARGEEPEAGLGRSRSDEPDLPGKLLPFWGYFMECMEGRFDPARDLSYDWGDDLEGARTEMSVKKAGGFLVVYAAKPEGVEADRARALQNEVLFDRVVRHFADQLVPVRLEKGKAKDLLAEAKVAETPAVVVFKKGGKEILKSLSGEITAKALVPLLRAVAADQEIPK